MIDYLMQQLSKELAIAPPLKPQTPGNYILSLDTLSITIAAIPYEGVIVSANLGPYPQEYEEKIFQDLLRANLFGESTHGAVLGLSHDGSTMTLTHTANYRLDYNEFRDIVEDFINTADFWRNEVLELVNG